MAPLNKGRVVGHSKADRTSLEAVADWRAFSFTAVLVTHAAYHRFEPSEDSRAHAQHYVCPPMEADAYFPATLQLVSRNLPAIAGGKKNARICESGLSPIAWYTICRVLVSLSQPRFKAVKYIWEARVLRDTAVATFGAWVNKADDSFISGDAALLSQVFGILAACVPKRGVSRGATIFWPIEHACGCALIAFRFSAVSSDDPFFVFYCTAGGVGYDKCL